MSDLKQRVPSTKKSPPSSESDSESDDEGRKGKGKGKGNCVVGGGAGPSPSMSQRALESTAHLANLLPTGTLLAFQLLTPVFTNNGQCDIATRGMTAVLLGVLALSCLLASFTDSFRATDGQVYYGLATLKGMFLFDYRGPTPVPDLTDYRLRFIDFFHALLSVLVFGVVAFRDRNIISCFYPNPTHQAQEVLDIFPLGVGLICSLLFVVFPTTRHGIGYPVSPPK